MTMEESLHFLAAISGPAALIVSIVVAVKKGRRYEVQEIKENSNEKLELEMKIKELEGKIDGQYKELTAQITAVKAAVAEGKHSNLTFETRMLSSVDKMENKIDRIQDLMVKALINKHEQL
jgi:uncharacterized protein Yka (UPF0111/DUF47 family)